MPLSTVQNSMPKRLPSSIVPHRPIDPAALVDEILKLAPPLRFIRTPLRPSGFIQFAAGDYTIIKTNYGDFLAHIAEPPRGDTVWIFQGPSFGEAAAYCSLHAHLAMNGVAMSRFRDENGAPVAHPIHDDVTERHTDPVRGFVLLSRCSEIPWSLRDPGGAEIFQAFLPGEAELFATAYAAALGETASRAG